MTGVGRLALSVKSGLGIGPARSRPSLKAQHPTLHAFTLIEMLVLIIIIAVLSSVVVPAYARFHEKAKFHQGVQQMVEFLASAREEALKAGSDAVVRFDPQTEALAFSVETQTPNTDVPTAMQTSQTSPESQGAIA